MLKNKLLSAMGGVDNFIEEVFSTYLYTGNGSTQTITNGIDLAGKGGLVWLKSRGFAGQHCLYDTARGSASVLFSSLTNAATTGNAAYTTTFNADGFGVTANGGNVNVSATAEVSWTFRKQPKFFDVVTYTGTGANRTVAHGLGAVPGFIIVKRTDAAADWQCYHRSLANTQYMVLNSTAAVATGATRWNSTTPTSTVFSLGTDATVNASGGTYVAYIYAHDAGGFGLSGEDNVISCGSFTTDGSGNATVNLGYEPQWLLIKASSATSDWRLMDTMRGFSVGTSNDALLRANLNSAESAGQTIGNPTATGFDITGQVLSATYIYIAIRRGPMKVPESGNSVFSPFAMTGTGGDVSIFSGFPVDAIWNKTRGTSGLVSFTWGFVDRLRGRAALDSTQTGNEQVWTNLTFDVTQMGNTNVSYGIPSATNINYTSDTQINWLFQRAPVFFDEVCYTGNNVNNRTIPHNLTVAPELTIIKMRSGDTTRGWRTYTPNAVGSAKWGMLNLTNAFESAPYIPSVSSTTITLSSDAEVNRAACNYVAYLFATCPGVSKVFSYTGNGSSQTINCGFTGGARFVLIKRTDSTGDWYVWDSARGIVAGNDPRLSLNTTAAEVTTDDSLDTNSTGFVVNQVAATNVNVNAATYIGLAIA